MNIFLSAYLLYFLSLWPITYDEQFDRIISVMTVFKDFQ